MKIGSAMIYSASALALYALGVSPSSASTEELLYSFPANSIPVGRPEQDSNGALYGTAQDVDGHGTVYRLKQKNGVWREDTLFEFNNTDGATPTAGPLMDRTTGVLYGTTAEGGSYGYGTVYSLAPAGHHWSQTVLHSFSDSDGAAPYAPLLRDKISGNLYGTTSYGANGCGTVYQLAQSGGSWTFSTVYSFKGGSDACNPSTQLKPGGSPGTLVGGTNYYNGPAHIFELKEVGGIWRDTIVYTFTGGADGTNVTDLDATGDGPIYGVAEVGGKSGAGVVFELTPTRKKYAYSVIYSFGGGGDGEYPVGINFDPATGTLDGTTASGGANGTGIIFKLTPNGNAWTETVLHSFANGENDGEYPFSRPIIDRKTGVLYGTTGYGGANNGGTVYMVNP